MRTASCQLFHLAYCFLPRAPAVHLGLYRALYSANRYRAKHVIVHSWAVRCKQLCALRGPVSACTVQHARGRPDLFAPYSQVTVADKQLGTWSLYLFAPSRGGKLQPSKVKFRPKLQQADLLQILAQFDDICCSFVPAYVSGMHRMCALAPGPRRWHQ